MQMYVSFFWVHDRNFCKSYFIFLHLLLYIKTAYKPFSFTNIRLLKPLCNKSIWKWRKKETEEYYWPYENLISICYIYQNKTNWITFKKLAVTLYIFKSIIMAIIRIHFIHHPLFTESFQDFPSLKFH